MKIKRVLLYVMVALPLVLGTEYTISRHINIPRNEMFFEKYNQRGFDFEKEKRLMGLDDKEIKLIYDDLMRDTATATPVRDGYEVRIQPGSNTRFVLTHELCHIQDHEKFGLFYNVLPPSYREWRATSCAVERM